MEAYTGVDCVAFYLSGGATNRSPAASLGGAISVRAVRGMTAYYTSPVQGLVVEDATPENGEGVGQIAIVGGTALYTPPNGTVGSAVAIAPGERKVLTGGTDAAKAVRIYRVAGQAFAGLAKFRLVDTMNGVLGMEDVPNADRVAGSVCYRAMFLKVLGVVADELKLWVTTTGQAAYALATETPSGGAIQTIADENTAPTSVTWVDAVDEASAVSLGDVVQDTTVGIWIRRTFPAAGTVAPKETINLHLKYRAD